MSGKELTRVEVLARVKAGALSLKSAAVLLQVSYRQAKRLPRRYRARGARKDCNTGMRGAIESRAARGGADACAGPDSGQIQRVGCINLVTPRGRTCESHQQVARNAGREQRSMLRPFSSPTMR